MALLFLSQVSPHCFFHLRQYQYAYLTYNANYFFMIKQLRNFVVEQFSELIQELAVVEAEILCLDRKIEELKLKLYYEQRQTQEMQLQMTEQKRTLARQSHVRQTTLPLRHDLHQRSLSHCYQRSTLDTASTTHSRLSFSYAPDFLDATSSGCFTGKVVAYSECFPISCTISIHVPKPGKKYECSHFTDQGHGFGGQMNLMEYRGCRWVE